VNARDEETGRQSAVTEGSGQPCERIVRVADNYWSRFDECQDAVGRHLDEANRLLEEPSDEPALAFGIKPSLVVPYALAYLGVVGYAIGFLYLSGYYGVLIPGQPVQYPLAETLLSLAPIHR